MISQTISHYKILEKLGAGGMGEVYRAEDLRLHRQVAVKVLPDLFANDPERLARFEREAKLLAALSHPNISAIHGLEEAEGENFLILELVEGETLAQRIKRGPLTFDDSLDVCRQIAEGLEAAHEKGIVHRDLKPSNIKITPDGKVKILDFGLARAFLDKSPVGMIADSPTITAEMTQPGVILGTAAYMSPEQAKGKPVDKRVDIWAFGCILLECLTGKAAFPGETITEVLASVLKGEPDWGALPKDLPGNVSTVLHRCLQKDRNLRYHDIADARIELFEPSADRWAKESARRFPWIWAGAIAGALLAGILIGRLILSTGMISRPPVLSKSIIKLEPGYSLDGVRRSYNAGLLWPTRTSMAVSSDGRFVVYCAVKDDVSPAPPPQLFLRRLDDLAAKPIAGTENGISPVLSADDKWIYFYADKHLKKVPAEGGVPQDLCEIIDPPAGISCGFDGMIYYGLFEGKGLFRVPSNGGTPEEFTRPDPQKKEFDHRLPHALPRAKGLLFTIMANQFDRRASVALLDPSGRSWKILFEDGSDARYVPTGHLVFLRQGKLMAVPFDLDRLEVRGQPVPVIDAVIHALNSMVTDTNSGAGQFNFSSSGSCVYITGGTFPYNVSQAYWVDRSGRAELIKSLAGNFSSARLSPDNTKIAYVAQGQIWIYDIERDISERLTSFSESQGPAHPVWTPDGKRLTFALREFGPGLIFWMPIDGSASMEKLSSSDSDAWSGSWSPDGNLYAYLEAKKQNYDLSLYNLKERKAIPFTTAGAKGWHAEFSPDGKYLAYTSDELGTNEVYVRALSGGRPLRISPDGGDNPLWGRSGKQIYFQKNNRMFVADILRSEPDFAVSKPRLLFELPDFMRTEPFRSFDLTRDEKRFLMFKRVVSKRQTATEMILVQNWFEELNRLVPAGKK